MVLETMEKQSHVSVDVKYGFHLSAQAKQGSRSAWFSITFLCLLPKFLCANEIKYIFLFVFSSFKQTITHYTHSSEPCFSDLTTYLGQLSMSIMESTTV